MEELTLDARYQTDTAKYTEDCTKMIELFAGQDPLVMLWQPNQDAALWRSRWTATPTSSTARLTFRDLKRV